MSPQYLIDKDSRRFLTFHVALTVGVVLILGSMFEPKALYYSPEVVKDVKPTTKSLEAPEWYLYLVPCVLLLQKAIVRWISLVLGYRRQFILTVYR